MLIEEIPFTLTSHLTSQFAHAHRSSGLHVSDIWTDLDERLHPRASTVTEDQLHEYGQIGFLWERVLESALADLAASSSPGRYLRCGEQQTLTPWGETIYYTPDCIDLDFRGDGLVMGLEEWKATWRSVRNAENLEKNHWKWLVQQKCYCRSLGIRHARLRVVYLVGDWRAQAWPQTKCWEMEFSEMEMEENWSMLMRHLQSGGGRKR